VLVAFTNGIHKTRASCCFLEKTNHKSTIPKSYLDPNVQNVRRNCGKLTYNRAQDKRRKKEVQPTPKRHIGALSGTSSEELELPGSNRIIMQN